MLAVAIVSFVVCAVLTYALCTVGRALLTVDVPNSRSLHDQPTPRGAGLAILATIAAVGGVLALIGDGPSGLRWVVAGAAFVAAVSWLDDRRGVSPGWRLLVHLIAAVVFVAGAVIDAAAPDRIAVLSMSGLLYGIGLVVAIAWLTNLYNFMDGMDGFAGGMTVIGFGALAILSRLSGHPEFAAGFAVIAGAAAGFLLFNVPPARIFLGDVGASTLGYLAAALGLLAVWRGAVSWPAFVLVFSPFLVDASITLMRRLFAGARIWEAHRSHFYQRLVAAGWAPSRTLFAECALMGACALTAVVVEWRHLQWPVALTAWLLVYIGLIVGVTQVERSHRPSGRSGISASPI